MNNKKRKSTKMPNIKQHKMGKRREGDTQCRKHKLKYKEMKKLGDGGINKEKATLRMMKKLKKLKKLKK